jgi:hypothetical protein
VFDPDRTDPAPFCEHYGPGPVFGFIARLSLEKGPGLFMAAASLLVHKMGLHSARWGCWFASALNATACRGHGQGLGVEQGIHWIGFGALVHRHVVGLGPPQVLHDWKTNVR